MVTVEGGCSVGHQGGVDRHTEADVAAEHRGQAFLDLGAQPTLELATGELVDDLDDGLVAVHGHRGAGLQPGPLVGLQLADHRPPCLLEIGLRATRSATRLATCQLVLHAFPPPFVTASSGLPAGVVVPGTPHPSPQAVKECDEPWLPGARRPDRGPVPGTSAQVRAVVGARSWTWADTTGRRWRQRSRGWDGGRRGNLVGSNLTPRRRHRQDVIHRSEGLCRRRLRPRGDGGAGGRSEGCRDGLTLWRSLAYRWPVTCRGAASSRAPEPALRGSLRLARRGAADHAEGPRGPGPTEK